MSDFLSYFQSYQDYFWEYENEIHQADSVFEALTIYNGNTIAFEKYIFDILGLLSYRIIPHSSLSLVSSSNKIISKPNRLKKQAQSYSDSDHYVWDEHGALYLIVQQEH